MIIAQKIYFIASFAFIAVLCLFEASALGSTWPTWFDLENKKMFSSDQYFVGRPPWAINFYEKMKKHPQRKHHFCCQENSVDVT